MEVVLTSENLKKLIPFLTDFEFDLSLKKVGLSFIGATNFQTTSSNSRVIKYLNNITLDNRNFYFTVVDQKLFLMRTLQHAVQFTITNNEQ